MPQQVHVTRIEDSDVFGHFTDHCDPLGCAGSEHYFSDLDGTHCTEGAVVDLPTQTIVEIGPNLGSVKLTPSQYTRECERLTRCYSALEGSTRYQVTVRPARKGEAEGTYVETQNGDLQILGYSIPKPDDLCDLQSAAWDLYCEGSRVRAGQRIFSPIQRCRVAGREKRIGRALDDGKQYQSHRMPSGRWSAWRPV